MALKYDPINPKFPHMIHGGDYNPDQWQSYPEVLQEDIRLMKLAGINAPSVAIFSWMALEPHEGEYHWDWLDSTMDRLAENGMYAVLATPSGAKPVWMADKYPEICRVRQDGQREPQRGRHNHCPTSPVYRSKCVEMNTHLAERYKDHPALLVWHVSNEYNGGPCHCELCLAAFRQWLKARYGTIENLNDCWWSRFWSHTFTDWEQINPVDESIHGMMLDWRRFRNEQMLDFYLTESAPLREITPNVPITTNMMPYFDGLDYAAWAPHLDVLSLDVYPLWHNPAGNANIGASVAFQYDRFRAMKNGKPWMLMESAPSVTNWTPVAKHKRPGMHMLASMQAIAHGSDTVQYFQWRAGRGGSEKFHSAVVNHDGTEHTRIFRGVAEVGEVLKRMDGIVGTSVEPQVAVMFDVDNRWALEAAQGPRREHKDYEETALAHYRPFWDMSVPVDVIAHDHDLSQYKLLIAPMLYMVRQETADRIADFVSQGGTLVLTYWSGLVDEYDRCYMAFRPGPLADVVDIRDEDTDALYEGETNTMNLVDDDGLGLAENYTCSLYCDIIHTDDARVLGTYASDFYADTPALTVHKYGQGRAYYVAARFGADFHADFARGLCQKLGIKPVLSAALPEGVTAQLRTDGETDYVFLGNYGDCPQEITLDGHYVDLVSDSSVTDTIHLSPYGAAVLVRTAKL